MYHNQKTPNYTQLNSSNSNTTEKNSYNTNSSSLNQSSSNNPLNSNSNTSYSNKQRFSMDTLDTSKYSSDWETLRKEARHIEQDLDVKLVSFSKLGSMQNNNNNTHNSYSSHTHHKSPSSSHGDRAPLLDFEDHTSVHSHNSNATSVQEKVNTGDDMFKTMSMEIQSLLGRLQEINQKLSDFHSTNGLGTSNASMMHTLQRHRDILQDFQHEFNKIKGNIETQREREDLLGSVRRDIDNHYRQQQQIRDRTNGQGAGGSNDMFISERDRLLRSNQEAEYAIQVGLEAREGLRHQRQQMQGMTGRVMGIMQKFPLINGLVHRINWRKKRDSLIMAGVISTCLILILLYWLRV